MKPQTGPQDDLPVPEWVPKRDPWYASFRDSLREVFGPRKTIRIKVRPGVVLPFRAPQLGVTVNSRKESFREAIRELFSQAKPAVAAVNPDDPALLPAPGLIVNFQSWKVSLRETVQQIFRPQKLPPLPEESARVRVDKEIWATKEDSERTRRTHAISLLVHATILIMATMPFFQQLVSAEPPETIELTSSGVDLSGLPPALKRSRGGGGGGDRSRQKASLGRLPRFDLRRQLAPPTTRIKNPDPLLAVAQTIVVPENLQIASLNLDQLGDPLSSMLALSDGTGALGGIGMGLGGGIGIGRGSGLGEGEGGGFGGGVYQVGGSVSKPVCIFCPDPEFSEEARKAKYSGTVIIWAIVDVDGRVRRLRVVKSVGLGLDEEAMRAVKTYLFRPSERFGKRVRVAMNIEVHFTLY